MPVAYLHLDIDFMSYYCIGFRRNRGSHAERNIVYEVERFYDG